jgi:hypothetical protein
MKTAPLISIFLAATGILCWHPTGHFLTALIAQKEIEKKDPSLVPYLESILKVLSAFTKEKSYCFVEQAEFPDDIKYLEWKSFNSWHFNDQYFYAPDAPKKDLPKNPQNLVWSINQCEATLRNKKTSEINIFFGKSFMLRYLVHLIGDIHQPLHNTSLVSKDFPNGDAGGNNFVIKYPGVYDLHTFWDMCLKQYKEVRSPLSEKDMDYLSTIADDIMKEFTREDLKDQLARYQVSQWSDDAHKLAVKFAYEGIQMNETPSADYIKKGFQIVKQQLALGGYRLADKLSYIFKEENRVPVNFKMVAVAVEAAEISAAHKIRTDTD